MSDPVNEAGPDARTMAWAARSAADYVGKYATSRANLEKVIARRAKRRYPDIEDGQAREIARRTAQFFADNSLVDDATFAAAKVRSGVRKGHSRRRIAMGLSAKGVEAQAIDEAIGEADDLAAALNFAKRRRLGPWRRGDAEPDLMRKEAAALGRNGFSGDLVRKVIRMPQAEAEDFGFEASASP